MQHKSKLPTQIFFSILVCIYVARVEAESKIGLILPLSGAISEMGLSFKRGVELYSQDNPDSGASFVYEDHRYDGRSTVTALHALKAKAGVDLVVVWGNAPSSAAAPVAQQQRIPMLAVSMNPDAKDRDYVVTFGSPVDKVADSIATHLRGVGGNKYGAIGIDIGNVLEAFDLIEQRLNGFTSKKILLATEVDFKAVISSFKSRSIDSLVLFLLPEQALTFLRQARQMEYAPTIIGGDIFAAESFQRQAIPLSSKISFAYGAVRPDFIQRLSNTQAGSSYFFEVATGYSIAAIATQIAESRGASGLPFGYLDKISTDALPIPSIKYARDSSFGQRFELPPNIYALPTRESK
ncbi:MAG: ABC transporter substrate-binding protein [Pseudomonadota bacterium]|jgi:ABC-type branched-subunit amino acid transport system substrate-binding protein